MERRVQWIAYARTSAGAGFVRAIAFDNVAQRFVALVEGDDGKWHEVPATLMRTESAS
jgi:hypothetical protein